MEESLKAGALFALSGFACAQIFNYLYLRKVAAEGEQTANRVIMAVALMSAALGLGARRVRKTAAELVVLLLVVSAAAFVSGEHLLLVPAFFAVAHEINSAKRGARIAAFVALAFAIACLVLPMATLGDLAQQVSGLLRKEDTGAPMERGSFLGDRGGFFGNPSLAFVSLLGMCALVART